MSGCLFFASTPLHIILSAAVALTEQARCELVCIDQPPGSRNPYLALLDKWPHNPFACMLQLDRHTSFFSKLAVRKTNFAHLRKVVDRLKPQRVFTGSDRRVEFQYAIARAKRAGKVTGVYLDEGTFSYISRSASRSIGDRYVDNCMKKLVYGTWWRNPPTTGASLWIDECRLFFPDKANAWLRRKPTKGLDPQLLLNATMQEFFARIIATQKLDSDKLSRVTHLLTLPHHSLAGAVNDYAMLVDRLQRKGAKVLVKYHPRSNASDYRGLDREHPWYRITGPLLFEALLASLPKTIMLIGDLSSTLLVARWLNPKMRIVAIEDPQTATPYQSFLRDIGVRITPATAIGNT